MMLGGQDAVEWLAEVEAMPDLNFPTLMGGGAGVPAVPPTTRYRSMAKVSGAPRMPAVAPRYEGYRLALGSHRAQGGVPAFWPAATASSPSLQMT